MGIRNHPPLTAFVGRVELELFGTSLRGFRFFVALAEGFVVPFAGLAARELGGEREAQFAAALAVAIQSPSLFGGSFMSYSSFDYLWWVPVGVLRNLLAQVGGSALVDCYRGGDRRGHDDQVHDGFFWSWVWRGACF